MPEQDAISCRYFVTYSGLRLPLNLVNPIEEAELGHRNTFVRAYYDAAGRLSSCEKVVYGQIELSHRYWYRESGVLERAEITVGDEQRTLEFDEEGRGRGQA